MTAGGVWEFEGGAVGRCSCTTGRCLWGVARDSPGSTRVRCIDLRRQRRVCGGGWCMYRPIGDGRARRTSSVWGFGRTRTSSQRCVAPGLGGGPRKGLLVRVWRVPWRRPVWRAPRLHHCRVCRCVRGLRNQRRTLWKFREIRK
jgi:hypothetical protein